MSTSWEKGEVEWAALMWARGLSCIWIGRMLRRLPGAVYNRLAHDGLAISRPKKRIRPRLRTHSHGYVLVRISDRCVYEHRANDGERSWS